MAIRRVGMSIAAAAAVLIGVMGCSVPSGDSTAVAPTQVERAPDRSVTLEVGTVIHPHGTVEYAERTVTLEVGILIHGDGTVEHRGGSVPADVRALLEAPH